MNCSRFHLIEHSDGKLITILHVTLILRIFFLDTLDRSMDGEISSHHRETSFEAGRYLESTPSIAI